MLVTCVADVIDWGCLKWFICSCGVLYVCMWVYVCVFSVCVRLFWDATEWGCKKLVTIEVHRIGICSCGVCECEHLCEFVRVGCELIGVVACQNTMMMLCCGRLCGDSTSHIDRFTLMYQPVCCGICVVQW